SSGTPASLPRARRADRWCAAKNPRRGSHRRRRRRLRPSDDGVSASWFRCRSWRWAPPSPDLLQPRECPCAAAELVRRDPQPLQHAHIEVAQRRRVLRVEPQGPSAPEPPAGQPDGEGLTGGPPASRTGRFFTEWLLPSPRLLPRKTIVRSSRLAPSSFVCFSLARNSRRVFIVSISTVLSCASLPGSLPWCDRSWCPSVTPGIGGAFVEPPSMMVMRRGESGCRGRWGRANSSRGPPSRAATLAMCLGGSTVAFRLCVLCPGSSP